MEAFATPEDLEIRMRRSFTPDEREMVEVLLADASEYLRAAVGHHVYPRQTVTFTARPDASGEVVLPQQPVVSVDEVTANGQPVPFERFDRSIGVRESEVTVTFTYGYDKPPSELQRWACVLVSQTLFPIERGLGLKIGGLSSVQLDDFRIAFANAGDETGMDLSDRSLKRLRQQFGTMSMYVGYLR